MLKICQNGIVHPSLYTVTTPIWMKDMFRLQKKVVSLCHGGGACGPPLAGGLLDPCNICLHCLINQCAIFSEQPVLYKCV